MMNSTEYLQSQRKLINIESDKEFRKFFFDIQKISAFFWITFTTIAAATVLMLYEF